MKKFHFLYYLGCAVAPHIMLIAGLIFLSARDLKRKALGKRICITSAIVLAAGSILYYIFFTPMFGLD